MRSLRELIYPKFKIQKRARKLLIEYDGQSMRVISNKLVAMAPPPSDPIANFENQTGVWISVRDGHNKVLYRKVLPQSKLEGIEVFPSYRGEKLYWLKDQPPTITLMVIIPDLALGAFLDIYGQPPGDEKGSQQPAIQLTSIALTTNTDTKGGTHERQ